MSTRRVALVAALGLGVNAGGQEPSGVERLAWLQGCWTAASPRGVIEELWTAPRGGSMLGLSRTVRDERMVAYELVVVREQGAQLAYQAHPSGQPSAVFLSRAISDSAVRFENLQHDFPQRIGYERGRGDSLLAWIEGGVGDKARRIDFRYRRARCAAR